ncbi:MAG TPA: D-glycero-beta-D-manno-heptose 1,7-bisphosphate 7-phosphatase [Pseudomonadales bacterium]|nr:D-glycero-beta-D-manno-heptose 1,7-bisphosphate 7-phosphatase [Pseudomonadales bacterium]
MKVVVLDRDGVINEDSDAFVKSVDEWIPIDGSIDAIARLYEHGFTIAVATNQSGIGRGLFSEEALEAMHEKLLELVREAGADIATIAYCPHKPEDYCDCRKPQSGLFDQISATIGCDLEGAWTIGDSLRDLQAGAARGCIPVLVRTGKGEKTEKTLEENPDEFEHLEVFDNLDEAADYLIQQTPADIAQDWLDEEY